MKAKLFLISAFALLTGVSFVSCNDDDKEEPLKPVFPELKEITVGVNQTTQISFTANMDWSITADENWITFMQGEDEVGITDQGAPGNITRTIKIKDTNWGFGETSSELTLSMGGESKVIYKITRSAKEREAQMFNIWQERESGKFHVDAVESIKLTFQRSATEAGINSGSIATVGFSANFDWKISSISEGFVVSAEISGLANEEVDPASADSKTTIQLASNDLTPYPKEGEITITDLNGNNPYTFPIKYEGMLKEDIYMKGKEFNIYGEDWKFSKEGIYTSKEGEFRKVNLEVATKDMEYTFVFMKMVNGVPQFEETPWVKAEDDGKGNIALSVDGDGVNTGEPRELIMYVFSPEFEGEMMDNLLSEDGFVSKYGFKIYQEGESSLGGFYVGWGINQTEVPAGSVVPFSEFPMFEGMKPSDLGPELPDNATYVYSFSNADVNGNLYVAPKNSPLEYPIEYFRKQADGWPTFEVEHAVFYSKNTNGIGVSGIDNTTTDRMARLLFYDSESDYNMWKASRVLIIIQQP